MIHIISLIQKVLIIRCAPLQDIMSLEVVQEVNHVLHHATTRGGHLVGLEFGSFIESLCHILDGFCYLTT